jgi:hypothetical protein
VRHGERERERESEEKWIERAEEKRMIISDTLAITFVRGVTEILSPIAVLPISAVIFIFFSLLFHSLVFSLCLFVFAPSQFFKFRK